MNSRAYCGKRVMAMDARINPHKVLLVEDEPLVAMMIEDMLMHLGYKAPVILSHVDDAVCAAKEGLIDLAILDVHVSGDFVFPVADALAERGVPFLFATGRGEKDIPPAHRHRPLLSKPFAAESLAQALERLEHETAA